MYIFIFHIKKNGRIEINIYVSTSDNESRRYQQENKTLTELDRFNGEDDFRDDAIYGRVNDSVSFSNISIAFTAL